MIGTTITHYRILSELGRGGMGVVYRAEDVRLGRTVALKFLPTPASTDSEAHHAFVKEARAAAVLDHPNICNIHEVADSRDGRTFIAMSCYDGGSLKDRIESESISISDAINYGSQVADGLEAAHEAGIIHRDIKPGNLMLSTGDTVKIVDFGLARATDISTTVTSKRTGTTAYMSPEQARGEQVDIRTDIWSLGVCLYEMVTGVRPFDAPYESAILYSIANEDPVPPREHNPQIPKDLQQVIEGCLAKDREERYGSAKAVAADLRLHNAGRKIGGPSSTADSDDRSTGLQKRTLAAILTIILVAIAAIIPTRNSLFSFKPRKDDVVSLAVIPVAQQYVGTEDRALGEGFSHYVSRVVTELERFRQPLWSVPFYEIMYHDLESPQDVVAQVYVDSVVRPRVKVDPVSIDMGLFLEEARTGTSLRHFTVSGRWDDVGAFQTSVVSSLSDLLDLDLTREEIDLIKDSGTSSTIAFRHMLLGLGYLRRPYTVGNPDKAVAHFQASIERDSEYVAAGLLLATAEFTKSAFVTDPSEKQFWINRALRQIDGILLIDSLGVSGRVLKGVILDFTGQPVLAEESFRRALEIDPANRSAFTHLTDLLERQDRLLEAEETLLAYRTAHQFYWGTHLSLGLFYDRKLKFEQAIPHYEKVIELAPDNVWGYVYLAFGNLSSKRYAVAESLFTQAISINSRATDAISRAYFGLGQVSFSRDNFPAAANYFSMAVEFDDTFIEAWNGLGDALHFKSDADSSRVAWSRAEALMEQELAMIPDLREVLELQAVVLAKLNREEEALQSIELILTQKRIPEDTHVDLAIAYEILGRRIQAIQQVKLAIANGYDRDAVQTSRWLDGLTKDRRYLCQFEGDPCESESDH